MTDVNQVVITGRLTANAEAKEVGERTVFNGSIAVNHFNKKEGKDEADFFNFNIWAGSSKQAEYYQSILVKGSSVLLTGSLSQQKWTGQDGKQASRILINASTVNTMSSGKKGGTGSSDPLPSELGDEFPM